MSESAPTPSPLAGESRVIRIRNVGSTAQIPVSISLLDAFGGTKIGFVKLSSSRRYKNK
jgi:hypothetical protein